jgi:hypothetical protein
MLKLNKLEAAIGNYEITEIKLDLADNNLQR